MIDTKELRIRVEEDGKGGIDLEEIHELLDRLEAAESARRDDYQNWMTALDRNAELLARLEAAEKERDEFKRAGFGHISDNSMLRAKLAEMERQEPVAWMLNCPTLGGDTGWILSWTQSGAGLCNRLQGEENEKRLYALPGAKGE